MTQRTSLFPGALLAAVALSACTHSNETPQPIPPLPGTEAAHRALDGAKPDAVKPTMPKVDAPKVDAPKLNGKTLTTKAGAKFDIPEGWKQETPSSQMRVAEMVPPRADGDTTDPRIVVTFFPGGAGAWDMNVDRWLGQVKRADGSSPTKEQAKITTIPLGGEAQIRTLDVEGTITDAPMNGGEARVISGGRLVASAVEASGGAYFFKFYGPAKSVAAALPAYETMLKSFKP